MGFLERIAEEQRQALTQDDKFWKSFVYFFELRVPEHVAKGTTSFIYPLVIAPESYRMSEPFAVEKTPTNGSGLWVEENGIIHREITLSGTTGWRPRRFPKPVSEKDATFSPSEGRSYSRRVPYDITAALSGHRHFQFLQDVVFRTYADLKRDPATAEGTELYFHNTKDDEHWRVIPTSFELERTAQSQLYRYNVQMLAVDPAEAPSTKFSEDREVLLAVRDTSRMARAAVSNVRAAILDLAGVQNELRTTLLGWAAIADDIGSIASAVEDFLEGTSSLIAVPYTSVLNLVGAIDATLSAYNAALVLGSSDTVGDSALNTIRKAQDALLVIGSYPEAFQTSAQAAADSFQKKAELSESRSSEARALAASMPAPASLTAWNRLGSSLLPGDFLRAQEELGLGRNTPRYTGADERRIERGDTLLTLAARYLGDARRWRYLAIFNDLRAPYISSDGLPGTLGVGDSILIPNFSRPTRDQGAPIVLGVLPEQPGEEHALGIDLRMEDNGRGVYDFVIDTDGGSVDVKLTRGVDNLRQGLRARLITEKGHDQLYKSVGVERVAGIGFAFLDYETLKLRLVEAVTADPRIASVKSVTLLPSSPDVVDAIIDAEVRGISRSEKIVIRK